MLKTTLARREEWESEETGRRDGRGGRMGEGRGQKPDDCLANHPEPRLHLLSVSRSKRENRHLWRHRIRKPKDPLDILRCDYKRVLPARDLLPPHAGSLLQIHNVLWHPVLRRCVPVHHRILAHNDMPLLPYPLRVRPAASEAGGGEPLLRAKKNLSLMPGVISHQQVALPPQRSCLDCFSFEARGRSPDARTRDRWLGCTGFIMSLQG